MSLADVEAANVEFIAYPYVVQGAFTVIDGHMGRGSPLLQPHLPLRLRLG